MSDQVTRPTPRQKHKLFDNAFLRMMREKNGLTLDELAARVDASKSHIWELENGRTEPSFSIAFKLAVSLGCDLKLFARKDCQ